MCGREFVSSDHLKRHVCSNKRRSLNNAEQAVKKPRTAVNRPRNKIVGVKTINNSMTTLDEVRRKSLASAVAKKSLSITRVPQSQPKTFGNLNNSQLQKVQALKQVAGIDMGQIKQLKQVNHLKVRMEL